MKLGILLSFILLSFACLAEPPRLQFAVQDMELIPNMQKGLLITDKPNYSVVLDCQSFIQGLQISCQKDIATGRAPLYSVVLWDYECIKLGNFIIDSIGEKSPICLDINLPGGPLETSNKSDEDCLTFGTDEPDPCEVI